MFPVIGLIGFMRISFVLETRSSVMYGVIEFRFLRNGEENRYNCGLIIIFAGKRKTKNRYDKIVAANNSQPINLQIIRARVFSFPL